MAEMRGNADGFLRPILAIVCANGASLHAWIDTAFQGGLIVPQSEAVRCGVARTSGFDQVMFADGYQTALPVGRLQFSWYGVPLTVRVLLGANPPLSETGEQLALLGLELLQTSTLTASFLPGGSVNLTSA